MTNLLNGIGMGLALSIMVGPILFTLIQTSLERGARAGLAVGLGIWISDLLFILASYWGFSYLAGISGSQGFAETLGTAGGLFLIATGLTILTKKAPGAESRPLFGDRLASLGVFWIKGFLVNTANPFTFFFWTSVGAGLLAKPGQDDSAWSFYIGVMATIIATDTFKVLGARIIRPFLTPRYLLLLRKISGLALILFGAALLIRVWIMKDQALI